MKKKRVAASQQAADDTTNPEVVDLMYPLAIASYEEAQRRFEVLEKRSQDLMTVCATVTLGILTYSSSRGFDPKHPALYVGLVAALLGIGVAYWSRLQGEVRLLSLKQMWDGQYSDLSTHDYKLSVVYHAAQTREVNANTLDRKYNVLALAVVFLILEVLSLGYWVSQARISGTGPAVSSEQTTAQGAVKGTESPVSGSQKTVPGAR